MEVKKQNGLNQNNLKPTINFKISKRVQYTFEKYIVKIERFKMHVVMYLNLGILLS